MLLSLFVKGDIKRKEEDSKKERGKRERERRARAHTHAHRELWAPHRWSFFKGCCRRVSVDFYLWFRQERRVRMRGAGGCSLWEQYLQLNTYVAFACEDGKAAVTSLLCQAAAAVNSGSINQPSPHQTDQALLCVQVEEAKTHSASVLLSQENTAWFGESSRRTVLRSGGSCAWVCAWAQLLSFRSSFSFFPLICQHFFSHLIWVLAAIWVFFFPSVSKFCNRFKCSCCYCYLINSWLFTLWSRDCCCREKFKPSKSLELL